MFVRDTEEEYCKLFPAAFTGVVTLMLCKGLYPVDPCLLLNFHFPAVGKLQLLQKCFYSFVSAVY